MSRIWKKKLYGFKKRSDYLQSIFKKLSQYSLQILYICCKYFIFIIFVGNTIILASNIIIFDTNIWKSIIFPTNIIRKGIFTTNIIVKNIFVGTNIHFFVFPTNIIIFLTNIVSISNKYMLKIFFLSVDMSKNVWEKESLTISGSTLLF